MNRLSGGLQRDLGVSRDPEELWSAFKTTILDVADGCLGTHRQVKRNFVSQGTLDTIDQSQGLAQCLRPICKISLCTFPFMTLKSATHELM